MPVSQRSNLLRDKKLIFALFFNPFEDRFASGV
jgi:hypothetical protein